MKLTTQNITGVIGLATTAGSMVGNLLNGGDGTGGATSSQNRATTSIRQLGVMRTTLFATNITLPRVLTKKGYRTEDLLLYADAINLPGVQIGTTQNRRYGMGPQQKYPNDVIFSDLTVDFIGDGTGVVLSVFNDWMNSIVRFDSPMNAAPDGGRKPFYFEYKDNYVAPQFMITVFNENREEVTTYTMEDAFPTSVSDINLNWGSQDELARFTVNFAYTRWSQKSHFIDRLTSIEQPPSADNSLLSMLFNAGTAGVMISSLKKPQNVGDVINVVNNARLLFG